MEFRRVLQMTKSVHWTTTIEAKNAVWHVYSNTFLWAYVWLSRVIYLLLYI